MGVGDRRAGRGGIRVGVDDGVEVEGLQTFELTEGVAVVALGGVNGALEAAVQTWASAAPRRRRVQTERIRIST
jgi:hypothetical protein